MAAMLPFSGRGHHELFSCTAGTNTTMSRLSVTLSPVITASEPRPVWPKWILMWMACETWVRTAITGVTTCDIASYVHSIKLSQENSAPLYSIERITRTRVAVFPPLTVRKETDPIAETLLARMVGMGINVVHMISKMPPVYMRGCPR